MLAEIEALPGRHLYFLDDHLFADARFAEALCDGPSRSRQTQFAAAASQGAAPRPARLDGARIATQSALQSPP